MNKAIQYLPKEYLKRCEGATPDQIIEFLENYRKLFSNAREKSQWVSLKVELSLLEAFKRRAELEGISYQTQIEKLMKEWLNTICEK
jgi:predicted DNA binding CopG/RHH family protein